MPSVYKRILSGGNENYIYNGRFPALCRVIYEPNKSGKYKLHREVFKRDNIEDFVFENGQIFRFYFVKGGVWMRGKVADANPASNLVIMEKENGDYCSVIKNSVILLPES